ncbi:hypothetical protein ScPMuIL_001873 [Solemya velum]
MACAGPPQVPSPSKPPEGSIVKLFITTYSDDFRFERELILKLVIPKLRAWCETRQLVLSEQFVKWGSRHPEKRDVSELEKVQTSIENCYFNNVMPIFLNFTSESLGWVPMWGECPDEYIEAYLDECGLFVEDLEVLYGAYREDNHNSLFLWRSDHFLDNVHGEERNAFVSKSSAAEKIKSLGNKIEQKFPPARVIKYSCEYKGSDQTKLSKIEIDDNLSQTITNFCKQRISFDYCGEPIPSMNIDDNTASKEHEAFMKYKSETVRGRSDILQKIEDYIWHEDKDVPLLLVAGPGFGKSSILCKAAASVYERALQNKLAGYSGGNQRWHVFFHFVGAVPGSTMLESMLKRLLREMEVVNDSNMPKGVNATAQMCCSMLSNPNTKPLLMFVDALNQFADDQAAKVMSWLPRKLVPQVRCVFSMINGTPQHQTLLSRETKPIEYSVTPLDVESRKGLACDLLDKYDRRLTSTQLDRLLAKESSENPLWLTVACEELHHLPEVQVDEKIDELPEGLLNLFEHLLTRFEKESGGNLVVATLCLLEASSAGLLENELRSILSNELTLMPPSPFDEKDEKETSEKESNKQKGYLCSEKWFAVFNTLKPFLRPYGGSAEGRIDFYHRALSKAVRKRYFQKREDELEGDEKAKEEEEESSEVCYWWHKKLADFFSSVENLDRLVEEYPQQLVCLDDKYRLGDCLCDWRIFDKFYNEEYSSQLLAYWRKVGSTSEMIAKYEESLARFEEEEHKNEEAVSVRYEKVCRIVIQAGKYHEALELLRTAMKIEEKELGARQHRMVELFALMAEIYDEKLKLNDFVSPSQLPDLRKTIHYGRKSITIRKTLPGNYHRFKLAMSLMKLAFNMESWEACGGSTELSGEEALAEGNRYIDKALKIFQELNDMGHYAEALMTKGVLAPRGSMEQLKLYNKAMDLCMQMYGEYHILTSRLYINMGIVYEDNNDYKKAYEFFKKWARVSEEILGPDHPKTLRAKGVLRESRYRRIARVQGEWMDDCQEDNDQNTSDDEGDEEVENPDIEHYYDDPVCQGNAPVIEMDNSIADSNFLVSSADNLETSFESQDRNEDNNVREVEGDSLMNGYYEDEPTADSGSNHENSDNENFYDDNFEDYDEQYILHSDVGPVIEEFNAQVEEEEDDDEIVQISGNDCYRHIYEHDNRYASDSDSF